MISRAVMIQILVWDSRIAELFIYFILMNSLGLKIRENMIKEAMLNES